MVVNKIKDRLKSAIKGTTAKHFLEMIVYYKVSEEESGVHYCGWGRKKTVDGVAESIVEENERVRKEHGFNISFVLISASGLDCEAVEVVLGDRVFGSFGVVHFEGQ